MNFETSATRFFHLAFSEFHSENSKLALLLSAEGLKVPITHDLVKGKTITLFEEISPLSLRLVSCEPAGTTDGLYWFTIDVDLTMDEKIWGTGQDPLGRIDHRNSTRVLWNQFGTISHASNIGIPFFYSSEGYGLMIASLGAGKMVFGEGIESHETRLSSTLCPIPERLKVEDIHDNKGVRIVICDKALDMYIWRGGSPRELLAGYYYLTGFPLLPPKWAFGYLQSKNRYRSQEEVLQILDGFKKRSIPIEALIIDWLWFKDFGDLFWDERFFPRPVKMIDDLHKEKIRLMLAFHPFVDRESRLFEKFNNKGILNKVPEGGRYTFDFSHTDAPDIWQDSISSLLDQGLDGYWADMGEPEEHLPGTISADGDRLITHNQYSLLWAKTFFDGHCKNSENNKERVFQLHRSGTIGIHRYGTSIWSGDISSKWEVFAEQTKVGLGMCASGFPFWCTDIGGFFSGITGYDGYYGSQEFSPELYIRWFQYGTFCPVFRCHGTRPANEPWSFGNETEKILRKFIELRYRIAPYIMNAVYTTCEEGVPLMRPLFFDYPDDQEAVNCDDQFIFGSSMMVVPVTKKGERKKTLYLPSGGWYDFWSGKRYTGAAYITISTPLDRIPVFIKAGAIIPVREGLHYGIMRFDNIFKEVTVVAYPGSSSGIQYRDESGKEYSNFDLHLNMKYDDERRRLIIQNLENTESSFILAEGGSCMVEIYKGNSIKFLFQTVTDARKSRNEVLFDIDYSENGRTWLRGVISESCSGSPYRFRITLSVGWACVGLEELQGVATDVTELIWELVPVSLALPALYSISINGELSGKKIAKDLTWGSGWATRFSMIGPLPIEKEEKIRNEGLGCLIDRSDWQFHSERAFPCYGYVNLRRVGLNGTAATAERRKRFSAVACAYAVAYSERPMIAFLEYGGENHLTIWVNNEKIITSDNPVPVKIHENPVALKKGKNHLLVMASIDSERPSSARELGFYFRFLCEDGTVPPDVLYSPATVG